MSLKSVLTTTFLSLSFLISSVVKLAENAWSAEGMIVAISGTLAVFATFLGIINTMKNDAYKNLALTLDRKDAELASKTEEIKQLKEELAQAKDDFEQLLGSKKKRARRRTG